jgi:hypothetical protein
VKKNADRERVTEAKSGRRRRWLVWGMVVSIIVLLFSPFLLFRAVNRAKFERKVAELKAAGYPVSLDVLDAAYVLPEGVENAADVYLQAFRAYVEPNEAQMEFLPARGKFISTDEMPPYPPEVINAIHLSIEKNKDCVELLDQASRMERCLFPRTRSSVFFSTDYLLPLKQACQLQTERNLYFAQTGQNEALYESTLTLCGLTHALSEQPMLIDHLVVTAIKAMVYYGLIENLNFAQFTDEQLAELQNQVKSMRDTRTSRSSIINERAGMIDALSADGFSAGSFAAILPATSKLQRFTSAMYRFSGFKDCDAVLLLEYAERYLKILQKPAHEQTIEIEKIAAEVSSYSLAHIELLDTLSAYNKVHSINLRVAGGLMCAETALAVERYRLKYGKLPGLVTELVPEFLGAVYLDPFDGKPLRYVLRAEGGYMIYSIGEDGVDNGGVDMHHKVTGAGGAPEHDWPFTVRR